MTEKETIKGFSDSELRSCYWAILENQPEDYQQRLTAFVEMQVKKAKAEVLKEVEQEFSDLILCNDKELRKSIGKTFHNLIAELKEKNMEVIKNE
jgi:hypothetical protein